MNNIVIVEDKLGRAISLAKQFKELAQEHPEYELSVSGICYFCSDLQKAEKEIQDETQCEWEMKGVNLINFDETLDEYLYADGTRTFIIVDFMLDDDGSDGKPTSRVNIRYARKKGRCDTNRLWFYTGTGTVNQQILSQLVGKEHVLEVLKADGDTLRLRLDNADFIRAITTGMLLEV